VTAFRLGLRQEAQCYFTICAKEKDQCYRNQRLRSKACPSYPRKKKIRKGRQQVFTTFGGGDIAQNLNSANPGLMFMARSKQDRFVPDAIFKPPS